ncbi:hypothetical protein [Aliiroseovarius subalbicans]|uniref:hypothetical protein n=1 Tax=Aliiroseovarius subalbicans TaxID=2925840 RepID=UPI001F575F79|nr:hypothetical protein [Aliiroseovarius subalbicans]MCI2397916.1 hypothetical protein [Aliiroseovarius subalbicans]
MKHARAFVAAWTLSLACLPVMATSGDFDDLYDSMVQDEDTGLNAKCHAGALAPERLEGDFTIHVSAFLVKTANVPTYAGTPGQSQVTLSAVGGAGDGFVLSGMPTPIPDIAFVQVASSEPNWAWGNDEVLTLPDDPKASVGPDEILLITGCHNKDLPRLEGGFLTHSQQGDPINHTMRFIVLADDYLFGFWTWKGTGQGVIVDRVGGVTLQR